MKATTLAAAGVHPRKPCIPTLEKLHRLHKVRAQLRALEVDVLLREFLPWTAVMS